jgi:aspartyl-tRNA(Asn)/glutamyl-tRNA(Gln) amidotransferase subunit A
MTNPHSNPLFSSIEDSLKALETGAFTSVELTQRVLSHVKSIDKELGSFVRLDEEGALEAARASDARRAQNEVIGALDGIPVSIKDQIVTKGIETTAASKLLQGYTPPYDATVVERLKSAGAVIVGKNNQDEFAMGSSTEHSAYQTTRNPHDFERVPGGSSGGSAAAVAAGAAFASLGTDTGGSIRQPASFCGVVGLKPTYGRVSRYGSISYASSLDQIGPLTRTVRDAALMLEVIGGPDSRDSTCSPEAMPDLLSNIESGVSGMRIGLIKEAFETDGLDPNIGDNVRNLCQKLEAEGAEIVELSIPSLPYAVATYYITATAEASSNLARYDGVRFGSRRGDKGQNLASMYNNTRSQGFGAEVKRRIMLGTYVLSAGYFDAYYVKAQKVRTKIINDFREAFESCDVLCLPTSPVAPFKLGEKTSDPLEMYLADIYTISCNLAGLCGISVPLFRPNENLPIGFQLLGKHMDEATLLRVARTAEKVGGGYRIPKPIESQEQNGAG